MSSYNVIPISAFIYFVIVKLHVVAVSSENQDAEYSEEIKHSNSISDNVMKEWNVINTNPIDSSEEISIEDDFNVIPAMINKNNEKHDENKALDYIPRKDYVQHVQIEDNSLATDRAVKDIEQQIVDEDIYVLPEESTTTAKSNKDVNRSDEDDKTAIKIIIGAKNNTSFDDKLNYIENSITNGSVKVFNKPKEVKIVGKVDSPSSKNNQFTIVTTVKSQSEHQIIVDLNKSEDFLNLSRPTISDRYFTEEPVNSVEKDTSPSELIEKDTEVRKNDTKLIQKHTGRMQEDLETLEENTQFIQDQTEPITIKKKSTQKYVTLTQKGSAQTRTLQTKLDYTKALTLTESAKKSTTVKIIRSTENINKKYPVINRNESTTEEIKTTQIESNESSEDDEMENDEEETDSTNKYTTTDKTKVMYPITRRFQAIRVAKPKTTTDVVIVKKYKQFEPVRIYKDPKHKSFDKHKIAKITHKNNNFHKSQKKEPRSKNKHKQVKSERYRYKVKVEHKPKALKISDNQEVYKKDFRRSKHIADNLALKYFENEDESDFFKNTAEIPKQVGSSKKTSKIGGGGILDDMWAEKYNFNVNGRKMTDVGGLNMWESFNADQTPEEVTDRRIADELSRRIRVVCFVMTLSEHHDTRAKAVKQTWGSRCTVLLFISDVYNASLPALRMPVARGDKNQWGTIKEAFRYVYNHHNADGDWFLKADDDTYVIMENLRYLLSNFNYEHPLYLGCRFKPFVKQGFMSGGAGYVLSRQAVKRLVTIGISRPDLCLEGHEGSPDVEMGKCLEHLDVRAVDTRDYLRRERFLPFLPQNHLFPVQNKSYWYWSYAYYPIRKGYDCCSDYAVSFHFVDPEKMFVFEYLIYQLHAYGVSTRVVARRG